MSENHAGARARMVMSEVRKIYMQIVATGQAANSLLTFILARCPDLYA